MTKSSPDRPPRISAAILAWLLHDDWQTPAGDFEEAFHHRIDRDGVRAARRWYRLRVLRLVPDRLTEKLIWNSAMFVTNLNISVRTLRRNPGFAAINMGGLAVGLAACILIMLFIKDELTFDAFHSNSDQIVRVVEEVVGADGVEQHSGFSRVALAIAAPEQIPEILASVAMIGQNMLGRQTVQTEVARFYEDAYWYVKPSFFELFDFKFISGSPESALIEPGSIVLTRSTAMKYFGTSDPVGQIINFERQGDFQVTGVLEDLPENSHLDFRMLLSYESFTTLEGALEFLESWENSGAITYLLLAEGSDLGAVESKLADLTNSFLSSGETDVPVIHLQPLTDIHFGSEHILFEVNEGEASFSTIWMFGIIAAFIMFIAVINYTNMTTAGSMKRAREIGMRKAVGANRSQIARQFFSESTVLVSLALLSALLLAKAALPAFNSIAGKSLVFSDLFDTWSILSLVGLAIIVGLLSGMYPALFLSRFNPVTVLKGRVGTYKSAPG